jgi:hypothetical protein
MAVGKRYIGHCSDTGEIAVAGEFSNGERIPPDWRNFIIGHEKGHRFGHDHADIAMLYEFPGDSKKALDVNAFRYLDWKNGIKNEGAETARTLFERYEGTGFQPYLDAIRERAEELVPERKANKRGSGYRTCIWG